MKPSEQMVCSATEIQVTFLGLGYDSCLDIFLRGRGTFEVKSDQCFQLALFICKCFIKYKGATTVKKNFYSKDQRGLFNHYC